MKKTLLFTGYYSSDDLARHLLRASGNFREAKKALTRASNDPVATSLSGVTFANDEGVYLAAYAIKKKKQCADSTALKKLLGPGKYRVFWNRLKERKQTLEEIARLFPADVFSVEIMA